MTSIQKTIHKLENRFDRRAERFVFHHPYLGLLAMFIGMPVLILITVTLSTTLIAFPMAWIFGWL